MARILFVHWNAAELAERAGRLKQAGFAVEAYSASPDIPLPRLKASPPLAVVIDLSRRPSHGREVADYFASTKYARDWPIVFVGGEPDKVARTRQQFPGAIYASWPGIGAALRKLPMAPPAVPPAARAARAAAGARGRAAPSNPAGYSGTPLPRKLGVDGDRSVRLIGAPRAFERAIGVAPGDRRVKRTGARPADVVMLFAKSAAELGRGLPRAIGCLADGGGLWIAWPKRASGVATDLGEALVRKAGLGAGLVDFKVCAIDATWSGLKFARRRV